MVGPTRVSYLLWAGATEEESITSTASLSWMADGAREEATAAGDAGIVAAALVKAKGSAVAGTVLGPPAAGSAASEGGSSPLTGFDRGTWGKN